MPAFKSLAVAALVACASFGFSPGVAAAQGNSGGRAGGPKATPPTHTAAPSTPPGQAKQPPAGAQAHNGAAKPAPAPLVIKPALSTRIQPLLPVGMTVDAASAGFKNTGQFVAAVHVAKNLDLPFTALKTEMVGHDRSVGDAIHTLKPGVDAKAEATKAEAQAKADTNTSTR